MKRSWSKFWLLWLCLLLSIFAIKYVNAAEDEEITIAVDIDLSGTVLNVSQLHTLHLWNGSTNGTLKVVGNKLKFSNWLVVWQNSTVGSSEHVVIGWWAGNSIGNGWNYAWIGWWQYNQANANYSVIGGWQYNQANANYSVIGGWYYNRAYNDNSVIGWWQSNQAYYWVVLGGVSNTAYKNSLAMGKTATSNEGSFAWNAYASKNLWRITASNGILIGTTSSIDWVNLVVDGAVKIAGDTSAGVKWDVRYVWGCFYVYDGDKWHVINRWNDNGNNSECTAFPQSNLSKYCEFGNTVLWEGDQAIAFKVPHSTNCNNYKTTVTCRDWALDKPQYKYSYCYSINAN